MTTDKITLDIIWGKLQATNILDKENKYSQDDIKKLDIISGFMVPFFLEHQFTMNKNNRVKKNGK